VSNQFSGADRDELYELYSLITYREIPPDDMDYIIEWVTTDKWAAGVKDMIRFLKGMPERSAYPLQDIVEVEAFLEHIRRLRNQAEGWSAATHT
jgi:hypothetical protein